MRLLDPLPLGGRTARNRVLFGPHETNLGRRRSVSDRHLAYYRRRAVGGVGTIVTEEASVHPSDWPYERAPLAADCADGWAAVAHAVHAEGALVLTAIGHAGGQGSSAYNQLPLWAPSRVPDVATREVPKAMEADDIATAVTGFEAAARLAVQAGLDGVEVNAGQFSLVRQFLSGLTNQRDDEWGADRLRLARDVLIAARAGLGAGPVLGLRLSCDELAPWAGVTPELAGAIAVELAALVDYLVVVRGSIYTAAATRPDMHVEPGFNVELCRGVRAAVGGAVPVFLQGSVVDVGQAEWALGDGVCDGVEMTRAQIAEPDLVARVAAGEGDRVRPCILCNQTCKVRDARNPIVTCVGEPASGHETEDPPVEGRADRPGDVVVVGGGPAGLECARVAALRGHRVRLVERAERLGGMLPVAARAAGRGRLSALTDWLETECVRLGVKVETGVSGPEAADGGTSEDAVVVCTGSRIGLRTYDIAPDAVVVDVADLLAGADAGVVTGPVAVWDPVGGPVGVAAAETLAAAGRPVHLVTPDHLAGNDLDRSGDLAPANVRLQVAGVRIERRSILRAVRAGEAEVEDRFTAVRRTLACDLVVDAGFRLPDDTVVTSRRALRAGDCVAPRTIHEAVREGRRAALALEGRS